MAVFPPYNFVLCCAVLKVSISDYITYSARMIGDDLLERTLKCRAYVSMHFTIWP